MLNSIISHNEALPQDVMFIIIEVKLHRMQALLLVILTDLDALISEMKVILCFLE